jgi:hypothetical protein
LPKLIEGLATVRMLVQQVAEIGGRPMRGRNRQQHSPPNELEDVLANPYVTPDRDAMAKAC